MEEYIPSDIREKYHIAELNFAMKNIHFPENFESYNIARERFVFEELLVLQLALSGRKDINTSQDGIVFEDINCVREFTDNLPFSLTNAQKKTLNEILKDCKSGKMMNRLVQGDVGSGKTAVAAAAIYTAVKNGHQAAMMAPTEPMELTRRRDMRGDFEMTANIVRPGRVHDFQDPLVGDQLYGGRPRPPKGASDEFITALRQFDRQALHATMLRLYHPITGIEMEWHAPIPQDMIDLIDAMRADFETHKEDVDWL